ncbi:MAG: glycosyltransferase [Candidatus Omnitrophota bacterium]|jgi:GT2 family glycosyltransferase
MEKKVCIIIPVKSVSSKFEACLQSLFNLDYTNFDVIVVDDSENGSLGIPADNCTYKIKILRSRGKGPSYARNLAAKNTDALFLAFTDSDCIVDENWLKELFKGFEKFSEAAACGGIQKIPEDASVFEKKVFRFMERIGFITDYIKKSGSENILEVVHNASCCAMYRKDVFLKEGGFLEGLWPGEDVELDYRLRKKGYKLYFNPKAIVYHYRPENLKGFLKMMYRYGLSCGLLTKMYGIFRKIQILPLLTACGAGLLVLSLPLHFLHYLLIIIGVSLFGFLLYLCFNFYVFFLSCLALVLWNLGFISGIFSYQKRLADK